MVRSRYSFEEDKEPGAEVTVPMTIAELITIRNRIIQSWNAANIALEAVDEAFSAIHDKDFYFRQEYGGQRFEPGRPFDVEEMTKSLDFSLYEFALGKLGITKAMTESARAEFLERVKTEGAPFDETQLRGLAQNADAMFRESSMNTVRQVYRQLIGVGYQGGNWGDGKKDNLQKVEKVFRIGWSDLGLSHQGTVENQGWRCGSASGVFRFNDLLTVCRLIEGLGFTDYSNNLDSFCRSLPRGQKWVDTGYFIATRYLNGNVKVNWNEEKIHVLEKLNAIGSGRENDLPDTMRKRYKAEHFHGGGMPSAEDFFQPDPDAAPSDDKDFAFFATREDAARRMISLAEYPPEDGGEPGLTTLEPSAGDGGIVEYIPWKAGSIAIEFNRYRVEKLRAKYQEWEVREADFLKWDPAQKFDRVLMNPPFNDRLEAVHVVKAFGHLKERGILVAILPDGWFTRDDLKSRVLRAFLQKHEYWPPETLPPGSFGKTRVQTRIVTLRKQSENEDPEG